MKHKVMSLKFLEAQRVLVEQRGRMKVLRRKGIKVVRPEGFCAKSYPDCANRARVYIYDIMHNVRETS